MGKFYLNSYTYRIYEKLLAFFFLPNYWIDNSTKNILDVGCGRGLTMKLINIRHPNINSTGIDIYEDYVKACKKERIYNKVMVGDVRKMKFKNNSFDVVICLQVIEHMPKIQAIELLEKMEKLAKKQIIVSTPYGHCEYHTDDGNVHQEHKSYFYPDFFKKRGYKTVRIGGKKFYGEGGLIHNVKLPIIRELIFVFEIFLTPYYLMFQSKADYYFFAYKKLN